MLNEHSALFVLQQKGVVIGTYLGKKYMGTSDGKGKGGVIVNVASMAGKCDAPWVRNTCVKYFEFINQSPLHCLSFMTRLDKI